MKGENPGQQTAIKRLSHKAGRAPCVHPEALARPKRECRSRVAPVIIEGKLTLGIGSQNAEDIQAENGEARPIFAQEYHEPSPNKNATDFTDFTDYNP